MVNLDHPTLASEGCMWFPDLTKAALSYEGVWQLLSAGNVFLTNEEVQALRATIAPMGMYGVIFPTAFYLIWRDNLSNMMKTVTHFYMRTFLKSKFEAGVLQGASRADVGVSRNVVRTLSPFLSAVLSCAYSQPFQSCDGM